MKSLLPLAAAAVLFTGFTVFSGFSSPASASDAPVKYATVRNWVIYNNGAHCTANAKYEDGSTLQFNIGTNGGANIAIWNPRWNIPKGNYTVVVAIDRAQAETIEAEADGYYVMMPWQVNEARMNLVSNGVVFRAMLGQEIYEYNLAGSREMLGLLSRCVAAISPSASNPFAATPPAATSKTPPASTDTPSNPFRRL